MIYGSSISYHAFIPFALIPYPKDYHHPQAAEKTSGNTITADCSSIHNTEARAAEFNAPIQRQDSHDISSKFKGTAHGGWSESDALKEALWSLLKDNTGSSVKVVEDSGAVQIIPIISFKTVE